MKYSKWLLLSVLLLGLLTFLVSCDIIGQFIPGFGSSTTTAAESTTAPVTTSVTTAATSAVTTAAITTATATTSVTAPPKVPVLSNAVVEKTPAPLPVFLFTGALTDYTVGYGEGGNAAAAALATALAKTAGEYDATVQKSIHLAVVTDGLVTLGAGDYHIYVTEGTIHILGGDAAGLDAAVEAFRTTVVDGVTDLVPHEHMIYLANPPADMETLTNYVNTTELSGTTEKDSFSYELGEEIIFVLSLKTGSTATGCTSFKYKVTADDTDKTLEGTVSGESGIFAITVPADFTLVAGSVRLQVDAYDSKSHLIRAPYSSNVVEAERPKHTYMGGAIIAFEDVTSDVPMPSNFEEFWKSLLLTLPDPTKNASSSSEYKNGFQIYKMDEAYMEEIGQDPALLEDYIIYEIFLYCDTASGRPAVGYVSVPKDKLESGAILPIRIGMSSYSQGKDAKVGTFATDENAIRVCMHSHGMPLSYYKNGVFTDSGLKLKNDNFGVKGSDFDDPATAELTKMLLRNIQMLRFLSEDAFDDKIPSMMRYHNLSSADEAEFQAMRDAFNGTIIFNEGGSMGGFQNIATAALCGMAKDIDLMTATVSSIAVRCPWMCDPIAMAGLTGRIGGMGTRIGSDGSKVNIAGLAYLDTVYFAKYLPTGCELLIYGGYADTTCPSSGIVALYNAVTVEKELIFTQNRDHSGKVPKTKFNDTVTAPAQ